MAISPGSRVGPYEVTAQLGEGRFLMVIPSATGPAPPYSVVVNWNVGIEP